MADAQDVLQDLIARARRAGADAADALLVDAQDLSVNVRLGATESVERSESGDLGLRVFVGQRQAVVSATDRAPDTLQALAERAVAMARLALADEFCGLAGPDERATSYPTIAMADDTALEADTLLDMALDCEDAARAVTGVTNSEGAGAGWGLTEVTLAASNGFTGAYRRTGYSLSAAVLAGSGTGMQRDYDYASRVFAADLPEPSAIGQRAGERAVRRLDPRKMPSGPVPVIFDPRLSGGLISILIDGISGAAVARGTSFLKDSLGQKIFPDAITVVEDPLRPRGLRSRAFDAEGLVPVRRHLIERGVLTTWLLDLRSARQLGLRSTGHATRSPGGSPHPLASNVWIEPGEPSPAALMADIKAGFYVTETMGYGVNTVSGDYSQAAAGFWIEHGEIAFPVSEMTISGDLRSMFMNLSVADDLEFTRGFDAPTLRIDGMTVAGQ